MSIVLPSPAQKAVPTPKRVQLKIPVWVEEADGEFWREGKKGDFKIFIDDREAAVRALQTPQGSMIVLVVFDTVVDVARVDAARAAFGEVIAGLGQQDWIGLLRAQDELKVIQEPTPDRGLLTEKAGSISVSGKAGLLDTLEPVAQLATGIQAKADVRLSILYLTDSGIGNYRADYLNPVINASDSGDLSRRFSDRAIQERMTRMTEALAEYSIPFFILHLADRTDMLNLAYQSGLKRIAAASGGAAIFCRTTDEIKSGLENLMTRMGAQYLLSVDQPESKRGSIQLRISVASHDNAGRITYPAQISTRRHPKKR